MGVRGVTSLVDSQTVIRTQRSISVNLIGAEARIEGTALDIARVMHACKAKLTQIENDQLDMHKLHCVHVPAPQEDEQ